MLTMQHVVNTMKLSVYFLREGKTFIAHSPTMDLSTCAGIFEKAKGHLEEVVQIFLRN